MAHSPDTFRFCPVCAAPFEKRLLREGEPERLVCSGPTCGQVLVRLVRGSGRAWLDLRGLTYLQVPLPAEA